MIIIIISTFTEPLPLPFSQFHTSVENPKTKDFQRFHSSCPKIRNFLNNSTHYFDYQTILHLYQLQKPTVKPNSLFSAYSLSYQNIFNPYNKHIYWLSSIYTNPKQLKKQPYRSISILVYI